MKNEWVFEEPIQVTRPTLPPKKVYESYVDKIWENKWLTNMGPLHEEFKEKVKTYLQVKNAELYTNGHLALEIALKSLDLEGEVITTPYTFVSTTHAIVNNGLTPVFCDIDPITFNIDASKIEELITEKTSAIVAVHVYGTPCDVEKIESIAKKYNLKVIYDAAHAFGVVKDGVAIGNYGDISMFSLHATKVFNTIEGGLLTFNEDDLGHKVRSLRNFGISEEDGLVKYVGINAKMNEFQAAMGLSTLDFVNEQIRKRKGIFELYVENLKQIGYLQFLHEEPSVTRNYAYFPVIFESEEQRDFIHEKLKEYQVYTRKYFYPLCNSFECYNYDPSETPIALDISQRVLCLPMYSDLDERTAGQISQIIRYELGDLK